MRPTDRGLAVMRSLPLPEDVSLPETVATGAGNIRIDETSRMSGFFSIVFRDGGSFSIVLDGKEEDYVFFAKFEAIWTTPQMRIWHRLTMTNGEFASIVTDPPSAATTVREALEQFERRPKMRIRAATPKESATGPTLNLARRPGGRDRRSARKTGQRLRRAHMTAKTAR